MRRREKHTHAPYRIALNVITEGSLIGLPKEVRTDSLSQAVTKLFENNKVWMYERSIQGFGVARRVTGGFQQPEFAMKIYVRKKKPKSQIKHPVPRRISIPDIGIIETDVTTIGQLQLHKFSSYARPPMPGCSISRAKGVTGTFGCYVTPNNPDDLNVFYLLTSAHVLTDFFRESGGIVEQPATDDQTGRENFKIGMIKKYTTPKFDSDIRSFPNSIDAGIALIDGTIERDFRIREVGVKPLGVGNIIESLPVYKVGRSTDYTSGQITDTSFKTAFYFQGSPAQGKEQRAGFKNLVLCDYRSNVGDSGALVLSGKNKVLGLHMGGSTSGSFFCRFRRITSALNIRLAESL